MSTRELLLDTQAFVPPARMLGDLADADADARVPLLPHSIAELVAHMVFWQEWFLKRTAGSAVPVPASASLGWRAVAAGEWPAVRAQFLDGLARAVALGGPLGDPDRPVTPRIEFPPLSHYTVGDALRHVAVHNAHHLGQIVTMRQLLERWPPEKGGLTW
jgi:uncharacterized damage-inducible protein DinB